ncbi:MAG: hypothetical protein EXS63_02080 [Candidatus Omnitrophica bacterium]|nr:hypothetical protein [Candidatus Omnitrophota bacterium]
MKIVRRKNLLVAAAGMTILAQVGCTTYGPVTNFAPAAELTANVLSPLLGGPAATSLAAAAVSQSQSSSASSEISKKDVPEQPHPTELLVEDGLAELITADQAKSASVDLWIDSGNDKRYLRFRTPYLRMQWDIVNLRLKDQKEPPIKLATKHDYQADETAQGSAAGGLAAAGSFQDVLKFISPIINAAVSYGGGGYGGGFGGSGFGQLGQIMEGIQKISATAQNQTGQDNLSKNENYMNKINEMFMQDGFAAVSAQKSTTDFSLEKPDYLIEEIWKGKEGKTTSESFRIISGDGHLLFQVPYHQTFFGISLFIRAKIVTGELDIKSEKYAGLMEAVNLWETGNKNGALDGFQKVLDMDPKFVNGYRYRARLYESEGRWQESIADLTSAIGILRARQQIKVLFERGQLNWKVNHYREAIKDFDHVLAWEPKAVWVQANRGFCWLEEENLGKASFDFEAALVQDPQYDAALNGRAWISALRGEYEQAMGLFNQVLVSNQNNVNALRGRGYCYKMLKNNAGALEDFNFTLQLTAKDLSPISMKHREQIEGWLHELR